MNLLAYLKNNRPFGYLLAATLVIQVTKQLIVSYDILEADGKMFAVSLLRYLIYPMVAILISILVRKVKYLGSILAIMSSVLTLLVLVETYFLISHFSFLWAPEKKINQSKAEKSIVFSATLNPPNINLEDDELGFCNRKNDTVISQLTLNGERLPDVYYIFDKYGRRMNRKDTSSKYEYHAIFMGCSATFGYHVAEDQSLPAQFSSFDPSYKAYNYGIVASGPNQYPPLIHSLDLKNELKEEQGIMVYPYYDDHVYRLIGDYIRFTWNSYTPFYCLEDGILKRDGNFRDGRFWRSMVFDFLKSSYFVRSIDFNYPNKLTEQDYALAASVINEMRSEYTSQIENGRFMVLLLPGFSTRIIPFLEAGNIEYVDCQPCIENYWSGNYTFPMDNHANGQAYQLIARCLSSYLETGQP